MAIRSSGILLHPTSLPGGHGIGDLGPEGLRFAEFLAQTGQRFWQMLPLNPVDTAHGCSPYHSVSAFAGNPMLISLSYLARQGLLKKSELPASSEFPAGAVDFQKVVSRKKALLQQACSRFFSKKQPAAYHRFVLKSSWLKDYALFEALREHYDNRSWTRWPVELRDRHKDALALASDRFFERIKWHRFLQFIFFQQWHHLKRRCNRRNIEIIGDMPIYQPLDSADVWSHPHLYKLGPDKLPTALSGVPPDYFSETGQLWGHPVYRWDVMQKNGYKWWIDRIAHNLRLFDRVRIDHFRGLVGYWEIPAGSETALNGQWVSVPTHDFFRRLFRRFPHLPVIAEDLGEITADVREVIKTYGFPGMRVLQFAFGGDFPKSSFLPHHHVRNCIVYTGTHDNNTARGWFENEAGQKERQNLFRYAGGKIEKNAVHRLFVRMAMNSVANTAVIPMQDVLGLGADARMNKPASDRENWSWRMPPDWLSQGAVDFLQAVTESSDRK